MTNTEFKAVRGKKAEKRCKVFAEDGYSPGLCDCGCRTPQAGDSDYNLTGITLTADNDLMRDGVVIGDVNPQYETVDIDGTEYMQVQPHSPLYRFVLAARANADNTDGETGSTDAETAAAEANAEKAMQTTQDNDHKNHAGYCPKCKTYCYGDCTSN